MEEFLMKYKILGRSGLKVSELCLGTMTFGTDWGKMGVDKEEARKVFETFAQAGGNFIDTANKYTEGTSERFLGEFVRPQRHKFVIATKYTLVMDPTDPNSCGNHRKNLFQSVKASLERLSTDYIDLLWIHAWDFQSPVEEVMRALDDLVRMGKVHYVGMSDAPAWVVAQANTLALEKGWTPFIALQLQYSLADRNIERELIPMAKAFGLAIIAWSPLGGGVLTGKYLNDLEAGRLSPDDPWGKEFLTDRNRKIVEEVLKIGKEINRSSAQVALNWLLQKKTIPIIGARTEKQILDNLACVEFKLSESQLDRLDEASKIKLGFPYDFFENEMARSMVFGDIAIEKD
jgi:aryl-alcohol dehydrogenase-like predicted oxidoreductase